MGTHTEIKCKVCGKYIMEVPCHIDDKDDDIYPICKRCAGRAVFKKPHPIPTTPQYREHWMEFVPCESCAGGGKKCRPCYHNQDVILRLRDRFLDEDTSLPDTENEIFQEDVEEWDDV